MNPGVAAAVHALGGLDLDARGARLMLEQGALQASVVHQSNTRWKRAALICCDVLEWSAKETAELLSLSVASVNSALQRAREALENEQVTGVRVRHKPHPHKSRSYFART